MCWLSLQLSLESGHINPTHHGSKWPGHEAWSSHPWKNGELIESYWKCSQQTCEVRPLELYEIVPLQPSAGNERLWLEVVTKHQYEEGKAEGTRKQRGPSIPGPFYFICLHVHKWQISQLHPKSGSRVTEDASLSSPTAGPGINRHMESLLNNRTVADSGVKGAGGSFVKASSRSHLSQTRLLTLTIMPRA